VLSTPRSSAGRARPGARTAFDSVLLVTGEDGPASGREYPLERAAGCCGRFLGLWIEVQPLPQEDLRSLAVDGLSAVLVYQETYDGRGLREGIT